MTNTSMTKYMGEFKKRLTTYSVCLALIFLVLFYFAKPLYALLSRPLLNQLPQHSSLIATEVAAPLITPLKLAWLTALLLSIPIGLYQLWKFITPALYKRERRQLWPFILSSMLLCYLGMLFAYFVVLPLLFQFFNRQLPHGVQFMPDISRYLDFCTQLLFCFGFTFEIPLVTLLLVYLGICNKKQLASLRPYIIIGAFVLGMLLTPPDVISQCLLAIPMWLLFEIGILIAPKPDN